MVKQLAAFMETFVENTLQTAINENCIKTIRIFTFFKIWDIGKPPVQSHVIKFKTVPKKKKLKLVL